jgi:HAD superfamily hydrolase (TIGR01509 family)
MNKLIIFDLDGVLLDSREIHYITLNKALALVDDKYVISREEHLSTYDGLSTTKKLEMLTNDRGLLKADHQFIWEQKQKFTVEEYDAIQHSVYLIHIFKTLQGRGFKIAVASNSIRKTLGIALSRLGVLPFVDYFTSNEDVKRPKPYPEMYWQCMTACNAVPAETWIVEDSHIGRQAATDSGAHLIPVKDVHDVDLERILEALELNSKKENKVKWRDPKLNVVIPMAGAGSRFTAAGFSFPKPLIDVNGKPMIQVIVDNLNMEANFIFIVQKEHYETYQLQYLLNLIAPNCKIVQVDGLTEGAAATVLLAQEYIDNDNPVLVANSDQYIEWNSNEVMYAFGADSIAGGILTFKSTHPKWSYVTLDDNGFVGEVAEKRVISDNATVGVYYWRRGADLVYSIKKMMTDETRRVNGEWYLAPSINVLLEEGKKFRVKNVKEMHGIGTPEDLQAFLSRAK